jgi:hypothetical protein
MSYRQSSYKENLPLGEKIADRRKNAGFLTESRPEVIPEEVKEAAEVDETDSENGQVKTINSKLDKKDDIKKQTLNLSHATSFALPSPSRNPFNI